MRVVPYFIFVIVLGVSVVTINGSSAYAKTVEAGDSSSSWNGTGEFLELGNGEQVVNGIVKGMLISRHKDGGKMIVHSSKLSCPVRVNLNRNKDYQAIEGLCTIIAHEGKDIAYAHWKCVRAILRSPAEPVGSTASPGQPHFRQASSLSSRKGKTVKPSGMRSGRT